MVMVARYHSGHASARVGGRQRGPCPAHMVDDGALIQVFLACSGHRSRRVLLILPDRQHHLGPRTGVDLRASKASLNQSEGLAAQ